MRTRHRVVFQDAADLSFLEAASVELVLTSPPYPMIAMWDQAFSRRDRQVASALREGDGWQAFGRMHDALDRVWREAHRVLRPGGFACIVVGDAVRSLRGRFALYPNHARILQALLEIGFTPLPSILWRKQTNAPTKFMGSGMYPAGAYVTLEHEHILIARKGAPRDFTAIEEKRRRHESALFWEERNGWYSDVWFDLKGTRQERLSASGRDRSGAFPFELAYRLICMHTIRGDTVLDPFLGTGTTLRAAAAAGRNSVGCEIEKDLRAEIFADPARWLPAARHRAASRLEEHRSFVAARRASGKTMLHESRRYGFPVITRQESELWIPLPAAARREAEDLWVVSYEEPPAPPAAAAPPAGGPAPPGRLPGRRRRRHPPPRQASFTWDESG